MANFRNLRGIGNPSRHRHKVQIPTSCVPFCFPVPLRVSFVLVPCVSLSSKLSFYHRDEILWVVRTKLVYRLAFSLHGIGFVLAPHPPVGTSLTLRVGCVLEPVLACVASVLALCFSHVGPVLAPCWPESFRVGPKPW